MSKQTLPFDETSLPAIAEELGIAFSVETYRVPSGSVYAGVIPAVTGAVRLVLWPSLARVDVSVGAVTLVCKQIGSVEIYLGIEVLFRRPGGGFIFVTRSGKVNMVV